MPSRALTAMGQRLRESPKACNWSTRREVGSNTGGPPEFGKGALGTPLGSWIDIMLPLQLRSSARPYDLKGAYPLTCRSGLGF
jgi:hypothetical protein